MLLSKLTRTTVVMSLVWIVALGGSLVPQPIVTAQSGKVERSHRSDLDEFYQFLDCTDDILMEI